MQSFFKPFSLIVTSVVLLVLGGVFFAQCTGSKSIVTENDFESLDLGPFIEKDFPYVPTSMDASNLGASFPSYNVSARTLALKLQDSSYVCFDTDMLRWTVAWTGDFLPMYLMPQVSYKDYYNKGNKIAVIAGQPKLATGLYPGWSTGKPVFEDPREAEKVENIPVWGPIAPALGRWNGVYVYGNQAVLSYRVGNRNSRNRVC
jgi:hypothetical protein